jgi:uncharacterized protein YggU (UPF0235/DUF167 family)
VSPAAGVIVVTVIPGAKAPGIVFGADGSIVVRVRERAVEGKANEAVRTALARLLGVPKSAVSLVRGTTARLKAFEVAGVTSLELVSRVRQYLM